MANSALRLLPWGERPMTRPIICYLQSVSKLGTLLPAMDHGQQTLTAFEQVSFRFVNFFISLLATCQSITI